MFHCTGETIKIARKIRSTHTAMENIIYTNSDIYINYIKHIVYLRYNIWKMQPNILCYCKI